ncbi:ATP-grasp fold amidoligase family protein [Blastococcus sp. SYSU DS0539]
MPRSGFNESLRHLLQPAHRRIAGLLPLAARRRYLYLAGHGRLPRLRDPQTFGEKINWRIMHDRRPVLAWTCDKLAMKEHAALVQEEAGLSVPETFWSGDDLSEVAGRVFGRPWVLKPNHRSGLVRFGSATDSVDEETIAATRTWLRDDQSVLLGEWAYSEARPLYVIEEAIGDGVTPPDDYKYLVFDGRIAAVSVDTGRFTKQHSRTFYTPDWKPLHVATALGSGEPGPPPENLAALNHAAEVLGRPFDFMRVDLYYVDGTIWFSEYTPYPGGGVLPFEPREFDAWLGQQWTLPALDDAAGR